MAIRVSETMIFVRDMDSAIRFYTQQVGFKLAQRFDWGFATIDVDGNHRLGLMQEGAWEREYPDDDGLPRPRLSVQTDDFDADVQRMKNAGIGFGVIRGEPGKHRATNFFDADGNAIFLWTDPDSRVGS
ncbi:MAG TPA: VOC family protein [Fimbriimonadaceae bacterium]|nr:VOC family protein [Fimbriimonadaceae bacterium]